MFYSLFYNANFPVWAYKGLAAKMREHARYHQMSRSGIDLLEKMVIYDPLKRMTSKQALEHEFFADIDPSNFEASKVPAIPMTQARREAMERLRGGAREDPLGEIEAFKRDGN